MFDNKTFRLFISSTFNDFCREREILQTKVFPQITEYATKQGFNFQPIDLRWGISEEAQLDQKTVELCLNEVRECKSHQHPNFLIMIGDRYGWVPLPYAIDIGEFDSLLSLLSEQDTKTLLQWYRKDMNQVPAAYTLQERYFESKQSDVWAKLENNLQRILQDAVLRSELTDEQQRKYFTSATEGEAEEGIIPYIKPTLFQQNVLLSQNPYLLKNDSDNVFGFLRTIDNASQQDGKFIQEDYNEALAFKQRVADELKNTLSLHTRQIDGNNLDESYLLEFTAKTIEFLKNQVDKQKEYIEKQTLTPLQLEQQAQRRFAQHKSKNFVGQQSLRDRVASYVASTNQQPLLICGTSGSGKSSLMAKLVAEIQENQENPVLYRFVGATAHSSSSKDILTSLFDELNIDIAGREQKDTVEDFIQFSKRLCHSFSTIKKDVIILIDAVDQLRNEDDFLWLPNKLPENVKVIISSLRDKKHPKDSLNYQILETKISPENRIELQDFESSEQLLIALLANENRTLQQGQMKYFEKQFQTAKTPLYVYVAAQEIKSWKSTDLIGNQCYIEGDIVEYLKPTQQGIVNEFITNLSSIYHHNQDFINRSFGYLFASRDGLSERQLLELLAIDKGLIKSVAPEDFHQNTNKVLPLIHWSRLHAQLKPFLSKKNLDGEELMSFFHREFEDAAKNIVNSRKEHESLIAATQVLIQRYSDQPEILASWEKLYLKITMHHNLLYKDDEMLNGFMVFFASQPDKSANNIIIQNKGFFNKRENIIFCKCNLYFTKYFYELNKEDHFSRNFHMMSLTRLSQAFKDNGEANKAIAFDLKVNEQSEQAHEKYNTRPKDSFYSANNLAASHLRQGQFNEAEKIWSQIQPKIKELFYIDLTKNLTVYFDMTKALLANDWTDLYITVIHNMGECQSKNCAFVKAQISFKEVITITKVLVTSKREHYIEKHIKTLTSLANTYLNDGNDGAFDRTIDALTEVSTEINKYICHERNFLVTEVMRNCLALAHVQELNGDFNEALINLNKVSPILSKLMLKDDSITWDFLHLDYLVTSAKVNFHLQYPDALSIHVQAKEFVKHKGLQGEQVSRQLNDLNDLFNPSAEDLQLACLKQINDADIKAKNEQVKVVFFCLEQQKKQIESNVLLLLAQFDFTDDTPYEIVTVYNDKCLGFAKMIIDETLALPCLVYYFNGDVESIVLIDEGSNKATGDATFDQWLYLAVYIADHMGDRQIEPTHLFSALSFIELNSLGKKIFSQYVDGNPSSFTNTNAKSCIEYAKTITDIDVSEEFQEFLFQLQEQLKEEALGNLR